MPTAQGNFFTCTSPVFGFATASYSCWRCLASSWCILRINFTNSFSSNSPLQSKSMDSTRFCTSCTVREKPNHRRTRPTSSVRRAHVSLRALRLKATSRSFMSAFVKPSTLRYWRRKATSSSKVRKSSSSSSPSVSRISKTDSSATKYPSSFSAMPIFSIGSVVASSPKLAITFLMLSRSASRTVRMIFSNSAKVTASLPSASTSAEIASISSFVAA
mmetsp:Transcript_50827/g.131025  ORF Transcript_50827/g.131025 Transcript_50827/m.131025 type:complete len:217 (+) Transcript_50827:928-1578(+)